MPADPDLREIVETLLSEAPRSPQYIAGVTRKPLVDDGRVILELLAEGRIYTYFRSREERLFAHMLPHKAALTDEEKRLRFEARSYSFYSSDES